MQDYEYEANDSTGEPITGALSAKTVAEAVAELESQGLTVQSIRAKSLAPDSRRQMDSQGLPLDLKQSDQILPRNDASLDRHFDAVIERRETLVPALRALASELPMGRAKSEILQLMAEVTDAQNGAELRTSENAVRWLPLLASGFATTTTSRRLSDLIAYATRDLQNRSERRRLFAYPIILMLIALIVLGLLCLLVVPVFDNMFTEFGLQLPTPTQWIIDFTRAIQGHPLRMLFYFASAAAAFYFVIRLWTRYSLTTRSFGFATAGNSSSVSAMSSLTGQLAELLQIGVTLPDALWIAGNGCENYHFKKASEQLARDAYAGSQPLSHSRVAPAFPANVIHALEVDGGQPNTELLRELSTLYGERVQRRVDWSTGAMAQFSIILLGIAVGFLVIALFLPLVSLITALS